MNKLYLIGGAPTTGKSTLAKYLSKEFNIPWISCDQIREFTLDILRKYKSDFPDFFTDTDFTADEFLTKFNAKEISDLEIKQGIEFQKFLQIFIDNSYPWKSFIIEGVNILPEFINQIKFDGEIIPLFIIDEDADRARKVVFERGLWGPAKSYPDDLKENEVEWILEYTKYIKSGCEKYNHKYFEISKNDEEYKAILSYLKNKI